MSIVLPRRDVPNRPSFFNAITLPPSSIRLTAGTDSQRAWTKGASPADFVRCTAMQSLQAHCQSSREARRQSSPARAPQQFPLTRMTDA